MILKSDRQYANMRPLCTQCVSIGNLLNIPVDQIVCL